MTPTRFSQKTASVTGAAGNLGRAAARRLAADGAAVLVVRRDEDRLRETATAVESDGGTVGRVRRHVTHASSVRAYVEAAKSLGGGQVHGFFNNGGIEGATARPSTLTRTTPSITSSRSTPGRVSRSQVRHAGDAGRQRNRQHLKFGEPDRLPRRCRLCGIQARRHRADPDRCTRPGATKHPAQRDKSRSDGGFALPSLQSLTDLIPQRR